MFFKRARKKTYTDTELITLYKNSGEVQWLGELFDRYMDLVFGVCMKYLKDEDDAKDAVMQVFEKLVEALLNHEVENFKGWLAMIARNHCLMHLRSRQSKTGKEAAMLKIDDLPGMENSWAVHPDYEESAGTRENSLTVLEAGIEALPAEQQQCIRLFFIESKSYKEVAAQTGFELNKVKSYIQNGKRNLKIYVEKHDDTG